ncbi:MAG: cytochrome c [Cytophagales bacterium]|nr:MAG: cytochrome c [Cytophagales bacterium]
MKNKLIAAVTVVVTSFLFFSSCQSQEEIKRQKYITEGILQYQNNCANCHGRDGKGLAALYPPIAGSEYLAKKDSIIHIIKYGQQGPIMVRGKRYNRPMPAQTHLSDLEIAEIVTYIDAEWNNSKEITDMKYVRKLLQNNSR